MQIKIEYIENILINLCQEALSFDRVPVSAVVEKEGVILSKAYNDIKSIKHAEIMAMEMAMDKLNTKRLDGYNLYVSLEPCFMCTYACVLAHIEKVYFFSLDEKAGSIISHQNILESFDFKPKWEYKKNRIFEEILKEFFRKKR